MATVLALLAALSCAPQDVSQRVLDAVQAAYGRGERPQVIFDPERALFDSRPRTRKILLDYGEIELRRQQPEAAGRLAMLTVAQVAPLLADTLTRVGIADPNTQRAAQVFWSRRAFTDEALAYDAPVAGAVPFVRALYSAGARILYLGARDAPRQLLGTVRQLRDAGLPVGIPATELLLRPTLQTPDAAFRQQAMDYVRGQGPVLAAFVGEAGDANLLRQAFDTATVVKVGDAPGAPLAAGVESFSAY